MWFFLVFSVVVTIENDFDFARKIKIIFCKTLLPSQATVSNATNYTLGKNINLNNMLYLLLSLN